jgi:hypothetical protein
VRVDGFAYVYCVCTHLDGQGDFADHVAGVGAYHAAAQDFAVAVGFVYGFVGQHGLAYDVADSEDVEHVGTQSADRQIGHNSSFLQIQENFADLQKFAIICA